LGKYAQKACKPGSVPGLAPHRRPFICDACCQTPLAANPVPLGQSLPSGGIDKSRPARAGTLFGIAPSGACHAASVARHAVGSYPTVSSLPRHARRFVFCGAIRQVALPGRYPAPLLWGARTFLAREAKASRAAVQPSVQRCPTRTNPVRQGMTCV